MAFNAPLPLRKANTPNLRKPQLNTNLGSPFAPKRIMDDGYGNSFRIDNLSQFMAKDKAERVKVNQGRITQEDTSTPQGTSSTSTTSTKTSSSTSSSNAPQTTSTKQTNTKTSNMSSPQRRSTSAYNNSKDTFAFNKEEVKEAKEFRGIDSTAFLGNLYGKGLTTPITYGMRLQNVMFMNDFETSDNSSNESRPKLFIKGSSFASQINDAENGVYVDYQTSLNNMFRKFDIDVANKLNSYTTSFWEVSRFRNGLYNICLGLEIYYALDSILSYNAGSMGGYNVNRSYENYRNSLVSETSFINARNKLRVALRGMWFPPNFSALIRWFYQSYKVSPLDQSPVFRFVPNGSFFLSSTADNTVSASLNIDTLLSALSVGNNAARISSILKNVYPSGVIGVLPESCSDAIYDERMADVFVNDTLVWSNVLNTNAVSYYPISYSTVNNDIPYYMSENPTDRSDGLAFALQSIATANTATTGYIKDFYQGLRSPVTLNMKDQNNISDVSNFQVVINSSTGAVRGYCKPNNEATTYNGMNSFNAHNRTYYYAQSATTSTMRLSSSIINNYQRVYSNNGNAPKLIIGELINSLFQTKV